MRHNWQAVHGAFGTVIWVVCIAAVVIALLALLWSRDTWDEFGKDGLLLDSEAKRGPSSAG